MYLRTRAKIGLLLLVLIPLLLIRLYHRYFDPSLTLTFFDVGQGDSALVQFPYGKTMLIDGGGGYGKWNVGERVVFPELARLSILHLDYLLMSHPDNDHARGLMGVLREIEVTELWSNACFLKDPKNELMRDLRSLGAGRGVRELPIKMNAELNINGVQLSLFPLGATEEHQSTNNRSLVLLLKFAGCSMLYTGDIEKDAELNLIKQRLGSVSLLKVPHHGSKTSSTAEFLQALKPRWAIVSAGISNPYGHPHPLIMERYLNNKIQIFRTDFHGAIRMKISPEGHIECETARGSCGTGFCQTH